MKRLKPILTPCSYYISTHPPPPETSSVVNLNPCSRTIRNNEWGFVKFERKETPLFGSNGEHRYTCIRRHQAVALAPVASITTLCINKHQASALAPVASTGTLCIRRHQAFALAPVVGHWHRYTMYREEPG